MNVVFNTLPWGIQALCFFLLCASWIQTLFLIIIVSNMRLDYCEIVSITAITWTILVFIFTEGLGQLQLITWFGILAVHVIYIAAICLYLSLTHKTWMRKIKDSFHYYMHKLGLFSNVEIAVLLLVCIFVLFQGFCALVTVPHNNDSMTYHLARIIFWISNRSVSYYDTNVVRQNICPVMSEYINLHVMSLTRSDSFVNMLQFFSSCGSLILVYGILRKLSCHRMCALLGVILCLGMNIFSAEAVTTQVDMVGTFFLLAFFTLILKIVNEKELKFTSSHFLLLFTVGLSSGLLYITKTNVCIPAAVIAFTAVILRLQRGDRWYNIIGLGGIAIVAAILIVLPTWIRNYKYVNDILAAKFLSVNISTFSPKLIFINIIKNFAFVSTNEISHVVLNPLVYKAAELLGVDLNHPAISFGPEFHLVWSKNMDCASACNIAVPMVVSFVFIVYHLHRQKENEQWKIMMACILQPVFSMMLIKYQPWIGRLFLPSLTLAVIPIVFCFDRLLLTKDLKKLVYDAFSGRFVIGCTLYIVLCSVSFHYMMEEGVYNLYYAVRSISHLSSGKERVELYGYVDIYNGLFEYLDALAPASIGISCSDQYPILVRYASQGTEVRGVKMLTESTIEEKWVNENFHPDVIFAAGSLDYEREYFCNGEKYVCDSIFNESEGYSVWIKK